MDLQEIKEILKLIQKNIKNIEEALNINEKKEQLKKLEEQITDINFFNDKENSSKVLKELTNLKSIIKKTTDISSKYQDAITYIEMIEETNEQELYNELKELVDVLNNEITLLNMETLLSGKYDANNAIITIHPGAGGTESQDWALMLYRMYTKYIAKTEFNMEVLDYLDGDEAGIKSVSFIVKGKNAYGFLKGEKGVHRLVRISPFDANKRRHTSFAAVDVMPEIEEDIDTVIKSEDLEVDTYRASGAGGQHVNKTDSAIRIKHIPTGIVVTCQTERSQIQNRENAMKMLRSKIFDKKRQEREEQIKKIKGITTDNAWGSQIRSYVFCPYTLVKDHRTNYEVGNVEGVMDGKLEPFIYEYLKYSNKNDIID